MTDVTDVPTWVRAQLGKTTVGPKLGTPHRNNNALLTINEEVTLHIPLVHKSGTQEITVPPGSQVSVYRQRGRYDETMAAIFVKDANDDVVEQITVQLGGTCIRRRFH